MSQELIKQNKMLKDYVAALQKENDSRNQEKDVLLRQIERLSSENEYLRDQLFKISKGSTPHAQVQVLAKSKKDLQMNFNQMRHNFEQTLSIKNEIESKNIKLKQQIQQLSARLQESQSSQASISNTNNSQYINLRNQNSQLKQKIGQLVRKQSQMAQIQNQNKQLQSLLNQYDAKLNQQEIQFQHKLADFKILETQRIKQQMFRQQDGDRVGEIQQIKNSFHGQLQNKQRIIAQLQSKINQLQTQVYDNEKNSTVQLRQLRVSKADAQNRIRLIQRENQRMQNQVKRLELELTDKAVILFKKQQEGKQLEKVKLTVGKKEQEVKKSTSIIEALRENVIVLENKVKVLQKNIQQSKLQDHDKNIKIEQQKIQELRNMESMYKKQIEQLKKKVDEQSFNISKIVNQQKKASAQKFRQNQELKKIISQLNSNNTSLLNKLKNMEASNQTKTAQQQTLKEQARRSQNNQGDLRNVVQSLKQQLSQVRSDFKRFQGDHQKIQNLISSRGGIQASEVREINYVQPQSHRRNVNSSYNQKQANIDNLSEDFSQKYVYNQNFENVHRPPEHEEHHRVKYTKLRSPTQKFRQNVVQVNSPKSVNQDKWKNLQIRISQLRQQNQQLKQSLYS